MSVTFNNDSSAFRPYRLPTKAPRISAPKSDSTDVGLNRVLHTKAAVFNAVVISGPKPNKPVPAPRTKFAVLTELAAKRAEAVHSRAYLRYDHLNSDQQAWFHKFFKCVYTAKFVKGQVELKPFQVKTHRTLCMDFSILFTYIRNTCKEPESLHTYLMLERYDSSLSLSKTEFIMQMYQEFLRALGIRFAPSLQTVIGLTCV